MKAHLVNNGIKFKDDAIPVLTIGEIHVGLYNSNFPGFVKGIVEGILEGKKDEIAPMVKTVLINVLKQSGTITLTK